MPMIINSHGKAIKKINLHKLFIDASVAQLNQLYEELKNLEIKTASHAELDRLTEIYGFTRKNNLLVPYVREELPVRPSNSFHQRFRINSSGKIFKGYTGGIKGWTMSETIGVSVYNPRALTKLTKVSNE